MIDDLLDEDHRRISRKVKQGGNMYPLLPFHRLLLLLLLLPTY